MVAFVFECCELHPFVLLPCFLKVVSFSVVSVQQHSLVVVLLALFLHVLRPLHSLHSLLPLPPLLHLILNKELLLQFLHVLLPL